MLRVHALAVLLIVVTASGQSSVTRVGADDATRLTLTAASTDGRTWRAFGPPSGEAPQDLAAHPTRPDVIYAAAARGVLKSVDAGRSWNSVLSFPRMQRVAIHPLTPNVVLAAGLNGFARTTDDGATWQTISTEAVDALAFAPDGTLLVAWVERGLMRSSDSGTTWTPSTGVPKRRVNAIVSGASVMYLASGSSLFRSTNNGAQWSETRRPGSTEITAVAVSSSGTVYVGHDGVSRSTDAGANWTRINSGLPSQLTSARSDFITDIEVERDSGALVAALFESGIYRSLDGATWKPAGDRSANQHPAALLTTGTALLATSSPQAITRSEDGGSTWAASNAGVPGGDTSAIAVVGLTVYAADFDGQSLFVSTNGGMTWNAVSGLPLSPVMSVAVWRSDPSIVYAGTGGAGVWKSIDAGATWQPTALPGMTVHGVAIDPANPSIVYSMSTGGSVYRTMNGGGSWTDIGSSFNFGTQLNMSHITVDPTHPGVVYLAAEKAYVSRDGGTTWSVIADTGSYITTTQSAAYALVARRLSRSTDAAMTWSAVTPVLPELPNTRLRSIVVDEATNAAYLAFTDELRNVPFILRSVDGGTWETLPALPAGSFIRAMTAAAGKLYVASTRGGYAMSFSIPPSGPRRRSVGK